jgi:signal transduction histidine kinase
VEAAFCLEPHAGARDAMTTTILKVSSNSRGGEEAGAALRKAGIGVVEMKDWNDAAKALRSGEAALVVCDGEAFSALTDDKNASDTALPRDMARTLSHELRTPLSAMAGWLHLMESGKLDEAGLKRAIGKLRGNIDDQVRTIDRYLGATQEGQR